MKVDQIVKALKSELSASKVRYKEVAKFLDMSESGVKKMFVSGDISLSKLLLILKHLNIKLEDLAQKSYAHRPLVKLKKYQIDKFLDSPKLYFFYLKLREYSFDLPTIKKEYALTKVQVSSFVKELIEIDMIQKEGKAIVSSFAGCNIKMDRVLSELQLCTFEENFMAHLKKKRQKNFNGIYINGSIKLNEQQRNAMRGDLMALLDKYYNQEDSEGEESSYMFGCLQSKGPDIYPLK